MKLVIRQLPNGRIEELKSPLKLYPEDVKPLDELSLNNPLLHAREMLFFHGHNALQQAFQPKPLVPAFSEFYVEVPFLKMNEGSLKESIIFRT